MTPSTVRSPNRIATLGAPWECAVCPGAAHAVHLEQPEAVARLIRTFVRRTADTGA